MDRLEPRKGDVTYKVIMDFGWASSWLTYTAGTVI